MNQSRADDERQRLLAELRRAPDIAASVSTRLSDLAASCEPPPYEPLVGTRSELRAMPASRAIWSRASELKRGELMAQAWRELVAGRDALPIGLQAFLAIATPDDHSRIRAFANLTSVAAAQFRDTDFPRPSQEIRRGPTRVRRPNGRIVDISGPRIQAEDLVPIQHANLRQAIVAWQTLIETEGANHDTNEI